MVVKAVEWRVGNPGVEEGGRRKQGREKRTCEWVNTITIHV